MRAPHQLAQLARLFAVARRSAEARLRAERAAADLRRARIGELRAAIAAPLAGSGEITQGGLAAQAAWRAHLDRLLRHEAQALAEIEARIAARQQELAQAFGRERAARDLVTEARATAAKRVQRRADDQAGQGGGRRYSRSPRSGTSGESDPASGTASVTGSPGIA